MWEQEAERPFIFQHFFVSPVLRVFVYIVFTTQPCRSLSPATTSGGEGSRLSALCSPTHASSSLTSSHSCVLVAAAALPFTFIQWCQYEGLRRPALSDKDGVRVGGRIVTDSESKWGNGHFGHEQGWGGGG